MDGRQAPSECPRCGGRRVASILYGLPDFQAIEGDLAAGRIVLGGCILHGRNPDWACRDCGHRWRGVEFDDPAAEGTPD